MMTAAIAAAGFLNNPPSANTLAAWVGTYSVRKLVEVTNTQVIPNPARDVAIKTAAG